MATTGRRPWLASPDAKAMECDSAMPVSKQRSGYLSIKFLKPVPCSMAGEMTTSSGCCSAMVVTVWAKESEKEKQVDFLSGSPVVMSKGEMP